MSITPTERLRAYNNSAEYRVTYKANGNWDVYVAATGQYVETIYVS